jgi:type I restriction enzyme M protein
LNKIGREASAEFVGIFKPGAIHKRKATWAEDKPDGRWRCFDYDELLKHDKVSLDIVWIKDDSIEDSSTLPDPDVLAQEIVEDLENALDQFRSIAATLSGAKIDLLAVDLDVPETTGSTKERLGIVSHE